MQHFITIIKSDYLQRTRSYAFLITLCISLAVAYSFIPPPGANYSTIRIGEYQGFYNSAWIGYVTAIMASIFLSLVGFYLVNGTIKNDMESKIGQIIASTRVSNFKYLFGKTISNFLVLLTIALIIFIMSILLFFMYNDRFSFDFLQFAKPYLVITIPSLFFIAAFAVLFEVLLSRKSVVQNILFFFLFSFMLIFESGDSNQLHFDVFGSKIVTTQMENTINELLEKDSQTQLTLGYILGNVSNTKHFVFNGVDFPFWFILSRLCLMILGVLLLLITSTFFHRFKGKELYLQKRSKTKLTTIATNDVDISKLPNASVSFGILSLLKIEFLLLIRSGNKWLWLLNVLGILALCFAPLSFAHQMVLPVLWFLQVNRWSSLVTKERIHNTHFFTFASYKPINRLLFAQFLSGISLAVLLAMPLIFRYIVLFDFLHVTSIVIGGIFIVSLAVLLGVLSRGKKLFEVLFFMITYTNINGIPFTDYFGGLHNQYNHLITVTVLSLISLVSSYFIRSLELKKV